MIKIIRRKIAVEPTEEQFEDCHYLVDKTVITENGKRGYIIYTLSDTAPTLPPTT